MIYPLLNAAFLLALCALTYRFWRAKRTKKVLVLLFVLLSLTAIFDNLIIGQGIVAYNQSRTSGLTVGRAPIEDFAYTVGAVLLVPYLWHATDSRKKSSEKGEEK